MYVAELCFPTLGAADADTIAHHIHDLLSALRMNGQVCGREWPITVRDHAGIAVVLIPAHNALDHAHDNKYVQRALVELQAAGFPAPVITVLGEDVEGLLPCTCATRASYILYTNYVSLESSLRCGDCFDPVPLYMVPPTYDHEYADVICWQSDYQACDRLFMNSATLEQAGLRQVSRFDSSLTTRGRAICATIAHATGRPVYYYLYRHGARSLQRERQRVCPSCDALWLLDEPWHQFDFRCEHCQLLSNIAWDVRTETNA